MVHVSPATAPNATPAPGATMPREMPVVPPAPRNEASARPMPNPTLRLDAGLGMVVLEFRDDRGGVKHSYPSQRMLEAYRSHIKAVPGAPAQPTRDADPPDTSERFA